MSHFILVLPLKISYCRHLTPQSNSHRAHYTRAISTTVNYLVTLIDEPKSSAQRVPRSINDPRRAFSRCEPHGWFARRARGTGYIQPFVVSSYTRKPSTRAYILHTLFNFTTSRFNSADGFSTITRPYFSSFCRSPPTLPLPSASSLSPSVGFRDGAPLCARRQIGNIFSRNIAAAPASTRPGIYGTTTVYPVVPARY